MNIIPLPNFYQKNKEKISFQNYRIIILPKYEKAVLEFNNELENALIIDENSFAYTFEFEINNELDTQEYKIEMQKEITLIEGKDEYAFYLATRSLALIFNLLNGKKVKQIEANIYTIIDKPRFKMRSFMIDEARHFFGKEEMFKIIDLLSLLKINYLHWHLSDDQGFRINFKSFPFLESIGSKRENTKIENLENDAYDNMPYEHCYSYHDIKDIINYAKSHYIEIIPEIDIPGHTSAIIASYNELGCFNTKIKVPGTFGKFENIICPGKEYTFTFFKKLFDEILLLFKDSKYIHLGGDEVNYNNWEKCPNCQKLMKEKHFNDVSMLKSYFINEIANYIIGKGKKVIVWADAIENESNQDLIMQYYDYMMDTKRIEQINNGRKTIYSPCSQFYFNDPYAELPLITTYNRGIHLTNLSKKAIKNIIAMEGCIWSEWIDNNKMLEFMLNPRLEALSEACWTYSTNHNFTDFSKRILSFNHILDNKSITYASLKCATPKNKKYKEDISKKYRNTQKYIEFEIDKK